MPKNTQDKFSNQISQYNEKIAKHKKQFTDLKLTRNKSDKTMKVNKRLNI